MEIHIEGTPTKKDYRAAMHLYRRHFRRRRITSRLLEFVVLVVLAGMLIWVASEPIFGVALGVLFISGFYYHAGLTMVLRERASLTFAHIRGSIDDQYIEIIFPTRLVVYAWEAFTGFAQTADVVVLPISAPGFVFICRRCFACDADWEMFCVEARRRAGQCRQCGYTLKGSVSPTCPECGTPLSANA